jgi:CheY-like chemotaxis protein
MKASINVPTRVLVVDDDWYIVGLITQIFREEGYLVESAADGKTALERIDHGGVNVVVSDIMLPVMSGVDLAQALRARDQPVPLVLISALPRRGDIPDDIPFLRKPFDVDDLIAVVEGLLDIDPDGARLAGGER